MIAFKEEKFLFRKSQDDNLPALATSLFRSMLLIAGTPPDKDIGSRPDSLDGVKPSDYML